MTAEADARRYVLRRWSSVEDEPRMPHVAIAQLLPVLHRQWGAGFWWGVATMVPLVVWGLSRRARA